MRACMRARLHARRLLLPGARGRRSALRAARPWRTGVCAALRCAPGCSDLHAVATEAGDAEMTHFLEDYLLHEQAVDVEAAAQLVSRLRR